LVVTKRDEVHGLRRMQIDKSWIGQVVLGAFIVSVDSGGR